MDEGRFGEACARFEQSLRVEAGTGTKFNLADCWERIGRTASAQALFTGVAADAEVSGQADRARVARQRAGALEPRISRLAIDVEGAAPKLSVRLNRVIVEDTKWGAAVPVDPGSYQIEARAPGRSTWAKSVEVPANGAFVSVTVPELLPANQEKEEKVAPAKPLEPASKLGHPVTSPLRTAESTAPASRPSALARGTAIGLGVLGAGGLALGTVSLFKYRWKDADARAICEGESACTRSDVARHDRIVDEARSARTWMFVGFGAGSAALAGAALVYFTSGSSEARRPSVGALVLPDGSWGLHARGGF
jgi:hypothetical protein